MQQNGALSAKRMPKYHFAVGLPNLGGNGCGQCGKKGRKHGTRIWASLLQAVCNHGGEASHPGWVVQNKYFQHCGNIVGPTGIEAGDGSKTEGFLYWMFDFLTISLCSQNRLKRSVGYWRCWWVPSDKLVLFPMLGKEIFKRCRANTQQSAMSRAVAFLTSAHADGSHGLDLEHRRQAASRACYKQTGQLILKVRLRGCRWKCLAAWSTKAMLTDVWLTRMDSFVEFPTPK